MKYLSLFSGIEAASHAWAELGWQCVGLSEIDPFCNAVLAYHYPNVKNYGDVVNVRKDNVPAYELLVGGTPCFTADTLIMTTTGLKPICEIKVGDYVLTHKGHWQKVLRTGSKIAQTIFIKGQGAVLHITPNHPILGCKRSFRYSHRKKVTIRGETEWIEAKDIIGNYWASPCRFDQLPIPLFTKEGREQVIPKMSPALFWVVGRYLGDGWIRKSPNDRRRSVLICSGKHKNLPLEEMLAKAGLHYTKTEERTTYRYNVCSRSLARWIEHNFGQKADGKFIPAWLLGCDIEYAKALFEGYLSADGCDCGDGNYVACSINKPMLVGFKLLAQRLGYSASLMKLNTKSQGIIEGRIVNQRQSYSLAIYKNIRKTFFRDDLHFSHAKKCIPGDVEEVFNLEVENDNSYIANSIAVHNCQSFSAAGSKQGLKGVSGLVNEFIRVLGETKPKWFVWENVPGVLNLHGGEDFSQILKAFSDCGYCCAWRVLDARFFGVPQQRKRVFVVGHLGDWRAPAQVLFEPESLSGDHQKSGGKGQARERSAQRSDLQASGVCVTRGKPCSKREQAYTVTAHVYTGLASLCWINRWISSEMREYDGYTPALVAVAGTGGGNTPLTANEGVLRTFTPKECERLMGFADDWTNVPWRGKGTSPKYLRYKALGNSMAVPVMKWIGKRIDAYEKKEG